MPEQLVARTVQAFGRLDLLLTNAGGPPSGPFEGFDDSTWFKAVELSLMSHVRLIRSALPYLRQSKAASVLAVTSYSVKQPIPNLVLSGVTRLGVVAFAKTLADEVGPGEAAQLAFEVVLVGSMFDGGPLLIEPMRENIVSFAPGARLVRLSAPPVTGAVLLGMEAAGLAAPEEVRKALQDGSFAGRIQTRPAQIPESGLD